MKCLWIRGRTCLFRRGTKLLLAGRTWTALLHNALLKLCDCLQDTGAHVAPKNVSSFGKCNLRSEGVFLQKAFMRHVMKHLAGPVTVNWKYGVKTHIPRQLGVRSGWHEELVMA